jgi:hypothetical protein
MGFQKIDIRDRYKIDGFFLSVSQMLPHSNEPKKNFNKLPSWAFYFIILYENTNNKKFRCPGRKKKFPPVDPKTP